MQDLLSRRTYGIPTVLSWALTILVGPFVVVQLWRYRNSGRLGGIILLGYAITYYLACLIFLGVFEDQLTTVVILTALNLTGFLALCSGHAKRISLSKSKESNKEHTLRNKPQLRVSQSKAAFTFLAIGIVTLSTVLVIVIGIIVAVFLTDMFSPYLVSNFRGYSEADMIRRDQSESLSHITFLAVAVFFGFASGWITIGRLKAFFSTLAAIPAGIFVGIIVFIGIGILTRY
ncbi:MAG: hypothetical protein MOB07_19165 [Acidobacteria bacterium]|nr:hypothetical protein [Acidobacteriota bacterium]